MSDRLHSILDGPWNFFKDLVVFKEPTGLQNPAFMSFDEILIWIQCHNVPWAFMNAAIIRNIGERLGRIVEIDAGEDGGCVGKFTRKFGLCWILLNL